MKKSIILLIAFCLLLFASSCKNNIDLEMYLSEKRTSVYFVKSEDYSLTVYGEEREDPFISDGYVGSVKKFLTVRLEDYQKALDDASVTINFDGISLTGKFEYSPLNGKFCTEIETESLPTLSEITAVIKNGGEEKSFTLSGYSSDGIDYKTALSSVSKMAKSEIENMLNTTSSLEVRLRIILEEDRTYYYVSLIDKSGKTLAYLVDGINGEILASKTI